MKEEKSPSNSQEFLLALSKVIDEAGPSTTHDLRASLEKRGVKVDAYLARAKALLDAEADFRQHERRRLAMKARSEFLSAFDEVKVKLPKTVEGLRRLIDEFVSGARGAGMQQAALVQWRKYENATDDDLRILAEDLLKLQALANQTGGKGGETT